MRDRFSRTDFYFNDGSMVVVISAADYWEAKRLFDAAMARKQKRRQEPRRDNPQPAMSDTDYANIHWYD